jgi:hypothetical protein
MESKKLNRFRNGTFSLYAHVAWPFISIRNQKISITVLIISNLMQINFMCRKAYYHKNYTPN